MQLVTSPRDSVHPALTERSCRVSAVAYGIRSALRSLRKPHLSRLRGELAQVVDPVVRGELGEVFALAVAVGDGAGFDSGAAAGFHVGGGIAHKQTVFDSSAHGGQCGE